MIVKNVPEDRLLGKIVPNCSGVVVVLVENLCKSTTYYFCVSASNQSGRSANSEVVQCTTLLPGESVIPGVLSEIWSLSLNSFEVKSICFAFVFLNFCANILFDEVNTWCYRPDESILTKDEVRGWYTLIGSIKPCIDWY